MPTARAAVWKARRHVHCIGVLHVLWRSRELDGLVLLSTGLLGGGRQASMLSSGRLGTGQRAGLAGSL